MSLCTNHSLFDGHWIVPHFLVTNANPANTEYTSFTFVWVSSYEFIVRGWGSLGPLNSNLSILFLPKEAMRMAHGVKLVCYVGFCFLLLLFFLPLLRFGGVGGVLPRDNPSPSPLPALFQSIPTPYDVNLRLPFFPKPWNLTIHGHLLKD